MNEQEEKRARASRRAYTEQEKEEGEWKAGAGGPR